MSVLFASLFTLAMFGWLRCQHRQMIVVKLNAGTWAVCWCGRRVIRCDER